MRFKTYFVKYVWLFICLYVTSPLLAQTRIPDQNFAVAIHTACPTCIDPATNTLLPPAAMLTRLDVGNKKISNLTGIEGFTNLQELYCDSNSLASIPTLPTKIAYLDCRSNQLTKLNSLPNSLLQLTCSYNQLTSLPPLPNLLDWLQCSNNQMKELPALPSSIAFLGCSSNKIISMPILPDNLRIIYCSENNLSKLPLLPQNLINILCGDNKITELPALPDKLFNLDCPSNQLNFLPTLPNSLTVLNCRTNNITCLPILPQNLESIFLDNDKIKCLPNNVNNLRVYDPWQKLISLPLCTTPCNTPTTAANGLVAYYPFNGNANDESGNNNNGTVNNASLTTDRFGNANKAYSFADGNSIVVKNSSSLKFINAFSYSVWVSMKSTQGIDGNGASNNYGYHTIFTKDCDRDNFYSAIGTGQNGIFNYQSGTWQGSNSVDIPFCLNTWTHLATTYDGKTIKLFQNGSLISKKDTTIDFTASNTTDLYIGKMGCYSYFFNGSIDDLSIFNTALTDAKVKELYDSEKPPNTPPPPTATLTGTQTINTGQNATLIVTLTGTGPWDITLSDGQKYMATASPYSISVKPTATTTYTITSVKTVCNTGTASGSAVVTVNQCINLPTIGISTGGKFVVCAGNTLKISSTGGASGYTYQWKKDNAVFGGNTADIDVTEAGQYVLTATDAKGCAGNSGIITITKSSPTATLTGKNTFCTGSNTTLTANAQNATGTLQYQWKLDGKNVGDGKNTWTASQAGSYTVEISDMNGCKATATAINVVEKGAEIVSTVKPDGPITIYTPNTQPLSATLGYEKDPRFKYQWQKDGKDIAGATHYVYYAAESGSYSATISDADCAVTSSAVKVTVLVPTAISLNATDELRIYPNPTDGLLYVSVKLQKKANLALKLLNITGQMLQELGAWNESHIEQAIDISSYSSGTYLLEIEGKDFVKRVKILKK